MAILPSSVIKIISLAVIVAVGIGIFQFTDLGQYLRPETLRAYIQSYGKIAPAVYVFLYCIGPVLFVPAVDPLGVSPKAVSEASFARSLPLMFSVYSLPHFSS